jgi:hypothetical protein
VSGNTIYMAETGPTPHDPQDGRVVAFEPGATQAEVVAAGAPMLVDVEFGRGRALYALAQGTWNGDFPGSPARPGTGSLVEVTPSGTLAAVATGLSLPTSMEIIGTDAYVVNLHGQVWRIPLP